MRNDKPIHLHVKHPSDNLPVFMNIQRVVVGKITRVKRSIGAMAHASYTSSAEVSDCFFLIQQIKKKQIVVLGVHLHSKSSSSSSSPVSLSSPSSGNVSSGSKL